MCELGLRAFIPSRVARGFVNYCSGAMTNPLYGIHWFIIVLENTKMEEMSDHSKMESIAKVAGVRKTFLALGQAESVATRLLESIESHGRGSWSDHEATGSETE